MSKKAKYCVCKYEKKSPALSAYKESTCHNNAVLAQGKTFLEISFENFDSAPAKLPAVVRPYPLAPVTVTARLRQKQMVKGVAKTRLRRRNIFGENLLVEQNACLLHRPKQFFVTVHPGDIICPASTFHMKAMVFPGQLLYDPFHRLRA